jgi:microsomal dipeptidase-like Zn-dependent dipeptidase
MKSPRTIHAASTTNLRTALAVFGMALLSLAGGCDAFIAHAPDDPPIVVRSALTATGLRGITSMSADFDGDGKDDRALWQGPTGLWAVNLTSIGGVVRRNWGDARLGDVPVAADYDGDGKTDYAVWRASTAAWWVMRSATGTANGIPYGSAALGDVPVPGDYDGDGKADLAVWRSSTHEWRYLPSHGGAEVVYLMTAGAATDMTVARDYDGDGRTDFALWRPSDGLWRVHTAAGADLTRSWGSGALGDVPVPGDYDGDGKTDYAVWRASTAAWWIIYSANGTSGATVYGDWLQGDIPLTGADYDGDGKADVAVWRSSVGEWRIRTLTGTTQVFADAASTGSLSNVAVPSLSTLGGVWPAPAPTLAPVKGFADLHFHMMAEEAFGGGWMHGKHDGAGAFDDCDGGMPPSDHARVRQDMSALLNACPLGTGINIADSAVAALFGLVGIAGSEVIGAVEGSDGDTGLHLKRKKYDEGWPRWDTLAHHQGPVGALQAAFQRGMKVVVIPAVSYDWLCSILPPQNRKRACDEMADVDLQIQMVRDLVTRNASWMQVALTPQHARQIIGSGKLAIVLAIEASHIFGRTMDEPKMLAALDKYWALGVRSLQPVHEVDSAFAGAATHNPIFQVAQYTENCFIDTDCGLTGGGVTLGFDVDANCKNVKGLTPLGQKLIGEMIRRGMLIDVAHMSERGVRDTFALAQTNDYYPMYISHGHFREVMAPKVAAHEKTTPAWAVGLVRQTGGIFGLRTDHGETLHYTLSPVQNDCQGSSHSFAQAYAFGRMGLKVDIAFGADLNGMATHTRPRFGDNGACTAGFKAEGDCQALYQRLHGPARLGTPFDEKGLATEGLLPDLITDLKAANVDTSNLEQSAEKFLLMWERAGVPRGGQASAATDLDPSGVEPFVSHDVREAGLPRKCGSSYCPAYQTIGSSCRFDEECESGQCTAVLCDIIPGRCVCNHDSDCASDKYCAKKVPGVPGDNACEPKFGDHNLCSRDAECISGHCGGLVAGTGWCYTPGSKTVSAGCRVNEECTTNRCGDTTQTCLCNHDNECPSTTQFCGWGLNDGKCIEKRGDHAVCTQNSECASGLCGGFILGTGWCYTPGSKTPGSGCRLDVECGSNNCAPLRQVCVCNGDGDCPSPSTQYCGYAANAGNCTDKKGNGSSCLYARECLSGSCGLTFTNPLPHCK